MDYNCSEEVHLVQLGLFYVHLFNLERGELKICEKNLQNAVVHEGLQSHIKIVNLSSLQCSFWICSQHVYLFRMHVCASHVRENDFKFAYFALR